METPAACWPSTSAETSRRLKPGWPNGPVTGARFCGLPPTMSPSRRPNSSVLEPPTYGAYWCPCSTLNSDSPGSCTGRSSMVTRNLAIVGSWRRVHASCETSISDCSPGGMAASAVVTGQVDLCHPAGRDRYGHERAQVAGR